MDTSKLEMSQSILDKKRLPKHVAIIMDGNGRWAKRKGVSRVKGHEAGAKSVRKAVEACRELNAIKSLTLFAFSTENWRRSISEVNALFRLLSKHIRLEIESLHREGIRVVFMGRREGLSERVLRDMDESESLTKKNTAMLLNVAINYGGRAEIVDLCRAIGEDMKAGKVRSRDIDESYIGNRLYVPEIQNVDLLIRTSGEMRISNFLLWQLSYAEIFVTRTFWPDFRRRHLYRAFAEYQLRGRRFGGR